MGYRGGGSNYEERDKLFQTSINDKPVDKTQVKKGLADLFKSKALPDPCLQGHAWIRDWDGKEQMFALQNIETGDIKVCTLNHQCKDNACVVTTAMSHSIAVTRN